MNRNEEIKKQDFFQKRDWKHRKVFLDHAWKNVLEQLTTRHRKMRSWIDDIFLKLFKNKTTIFWRDPKKKIDKRKSRKVTPRNAINQEKTWNKEGEQDDTRRKEKQEIKHRRREGKKKKRAEFRREKWAQKLLIFLCKDSYGDEKKRAKKEEVKTNEIKNKREKREMS